MIKDMDRMSILKRWRLRNTIKNLEVVLEMAFYFLFFFVFTFFAFMLVLLLAPANV